MEKIKSALQAIQRTILYRIITDRIFLSVILGCLTFALLNLDFQKYKFTIQKSRALAEKPSDDYYFYSDLNSDSTNERYIFGNKQNGNSHLIVFQTGDYPLDEWNFHGTIASSGCNYFVGDFNHNNKRELVCFTVDKGRILLNMVEPYGEMPHLYKNFVIDSIENQIIRDNVYIMAVKWHDLNGDNKDELIFSVTVGLNKQPRKLYALDIMNQKLWSSDEAGYPIDGFQFFDADRDGEDEIFLETNASNNYSKSDDYKFPDTTSWAVVLNHQLKYKEPPIPLGGPFSRSVLIISPMENEKRLFYFLSGLVNGKLDAKIFVVERNFTLKDLGHKYPKFDDIPRGPINTDDPENIFFINSEMSKWFSLKEGVLSTKNIKIPPFDIPIPIFNKEFGIQDINFAFEILGSPGMLIFANQDGEIVGQLDLQNKSSSGKICWAGTSRDDHRFILTGYQREFTVLVRANPWQYLRFLVLAVLVGGFYLFILLIRWLQTQEIKRRETTRREMIELQLKSVRNQLDPHFTFNALNTLSSLSLMGDQDGVDNFIIHFSRLLRRQLSNSDQALVGLKEEIEFIMSFVELQRIRFDNAFHFVLDIDPDVDLAYRIPKMLIYIHVENAIKHGLKGILEKDLESGTKTDKTDAKGYPAGSVWLRIRQNQESLVITVEDNGCGRGNSEVAPVESTGTGLRAIDQIIASVKELYKMDITQKFEDLQNTGLTSCGTRVCIEISGRPVKNRFSHIIRT